MLVSAPIDVSDSYIHTLIQSKKSWINSKLLEFKNKYSEAKVVSFLDKKSILFLGCDCKLYINKLDTIYKCSLRLENSNFIADVPNNMHVEKVSNDLEILTKNLIIDESISLAKERVTYYSKLLNVYPKKLQIKDQKSTWGTCSSLGNIYLNYRIFLAPIDIVDYVIVHELCHLKHMNHSADFWSLVSSIIPDYKQKRLWLKENGYTLTI